ncbi:putative bifunctional diguanylate cyclase/phosphodiesterase [Paraglaciecola marina]|uniref:putative bifunctional diguanylate cyclase/phosphodiesterase n=1 Tax=Paraglaciecola marina TaxID=2500157 RepID=UPI001414EC64|nr:EAL domain-containing protein [Paraglaciecola marina]
MQRDALNLLHGNNAGSLLVTFCICIALVFGFDNNPEVSLKVYWLALVCVLFLYRYWDMYHWRKYLKGKEYDASKPMLRFTIARYLTAFAFSAYSIVFFESMDIIELACTIVILSAMAGGASTVLAAHKGLALSYAFILLTPLSVLCLFANEEYQNIFGILGLIFVVVMFSSAKYSNQFTIESILTKHQNSDLLQQMELKNKEILEVNASLESKVQKRTEQIFELSNIDPLTKLFNRNAFSENLKLLLDSCELHDSSLAVLFIDLDGFKAINDSHGHAIGDKVLIETSTRLSAQADMKQCLCRWGGDEFLIALQDCDVERALEFANNLIFNLSLPITIEHHELHVGATIGIAMYPEHGTDEAKLITLADTAMYVQKQLAKSDVCVFTEQMGETLQREIKLKEGLSQAIKNDELFVVFQPVIDSKSGQVGFCEALLRWKLNGELVSPMEFIPVAEQHGLIHSIGAWVLHESCKLASKWTFDETVDLSINVSVAQLMHGDLVSIVKSALAGSQLPAENLHIEITESIFAQDISYVLEQMKALQRIGIKVSVDDFGTGFSSLALLQSLSADVVKIDQSFIKSIDEGGKAIIQATQYMANELGYSVVAEGVETKQQADTLSEMGVECLQGFYFSKPMKTGELELWHEAFKAQRN